LELLAELIMGGNIGTRKVYEPVLEFRESFYICSVLSTLSHIKHNNMNKTKSRLTKSLLGLGVGTVTLPAIGTASGSALGVFGRGLTEAATFC